MLICQDLVKIYKKMSTSACYMMKFDHEKAYETVSWSFLRQMLEGVGFPHFYVEMIMTCVPTAKFSLFSLILKEV